ncbi:MAG: hypothetical protein ABFR97_06680 [Thermodesulfobacteriota bacterium]
MNDTFKVVLIYIAITCAIIAMHAVVDSSTAAPQPQLLPPATTTLSDSTYHQ